MSFRRKDAKAQRESEQIFLIIKDPAAFFLCVFAPLRQTILFIRHRAAGRRCTPSQIRIYTEFAASRCKFAGMLAFAPMSA